jgi:hypothetical protein
VVENFFVKNDSNPPMTQSGDKSFQFYLPAGAVVVGGAALAPGGMQVQVTPTKLSEANHYAIAFPLRPGQSRFQVSYTLPYSGKLKLSQRPWLPTGAVIVMMPKSMTFAADASAQYASVTEETTAQTYVARDVPGEQEVGFTVGGSGQLPRDTEATSGQESDQGGGAQASGNTAATNNRPGGGLGNPIDPEGTNDPWSKYRWWIIGGLGLTLAAGAGFMLRTDQGKPAVAGAVSVPVAAVAAPVVSGEAAVLAALKEELFALEKDRLQGKISDAEFAEQKAALDVVMRRALGRVGDPVERV